MSEQKAKRQRQLRQCASLTLGILGLALLLLMHPCPCHDRSQMPQPYLPTYKSKDGRAEALQGLRLQAAIRGAHLLARRLQPEVPQQGQTP